MSEILLEYDEQREIFESYALSLKSLLNTLVRDAGISVHTLEARVKNRKSLDAKIIKKGKYKSISDITDIVGVRIISHYANDVDRIAKIVEEEFLIDVKNSIDKRATLEPDRFGYLSLHYIVNLNDKRTRLREYVPYKNIKAEIQIRSILQHAWAEIEHDIGYKSSNGLPNEVRRYFSRLAGLLELADDEFVKIRKSINARHEEVVTAIKDGNGDVLLDVVSLDEFTNQSDLIVEIANELKKEYNISVGKIADKKELPVMVRLLAHLNITTTKQLNEALKSHKQHIIKRIKAFNAGFIKYYQDVAMSRDIIINFLTQVIVAMANSDELYSSYWEILGVQLSDNIKKEVFNDIRNVLITLKD